MPDPILSVENIVTRFGTQTVHDGISFSLEAGKVIALIGGSGSGKSVLLRVIIGLMRPTQGTVKLFGHDISQVSELHLSQLRNQIGVLFQNGALFSALSVADNVALPMREQSNLPRAVVDDLVNLRLALSGLAADVANKMPSELSGGMRKRVALARALALEPRLLFLDEPTSGLDPINARAFDQLIRSLCDNLGLTVVMATHDLDTISSIVDELLVLSDGKLIAQDKVEVVKKIDNAWIKEYFAARVTDDTI